MAQGSCSLNILFQFVRCSSGVARNFVWDIMGHSSTRMVFFLTNSSFSATGQSITARCSCTFLALNDLSVC